MTDAQPLIPTQFREPTPAPDDVDQAPQHDRPDDDAGILAAGKLYQDWHDPEPAPAAPERDGEAVSATPAAAPPPPDTAPRTPIAAGTYAVYDDGSGGVVLVIGTREGETHHKHIPAKLIKMGEMMMGGNNPLAAMFGGMV